MPTDREALAKDSLRGSRSESFRKRSVCRSYGRRPRVAQGAIYTGVRPRRSLGRPGACGGSCSSANNQAIRRRTFPAGRSSGAAGRLLDEALKEAGIERSTCYVTNIVKHFKWTPRGKASLARQTERPGDSGLPTLAGSGNRSRRRRTSCLPGRHGGTRFTGSRFSDHSPAWQITG